MNTLSRLSLVSIAAAILASSPLVQADSKTRSQVKSELAEAIRTGDIGLDEQGRKNNELAPHRYPARPKAVGKTRDEVKAELAEAIRTGSIVRDELGRTDYEMAPHRYPARVVASGKTREQVKQELAEAIRLGDTPIDELGRTPAERFPARYAAVRAEHAVAMKARQAEQTAQGVGEAAVVR